MRKLPLPTVTTLALVATWVAVVVFGALSLCGRRGDSQSSHHGDGGPALRGDR